MPRYLLVSVLAAVMLLSNQTKTSPEEEVVVETISSDVTITVVDGSVTPVSVALCLHNGTDMDIMYGTSYRLQRMEHGRWQEQPYIIDNWAFTSIGYSLESGNTSDIEINWEIFHGPMEAGQYRIVMEVMDFRKTGDFDTYEISAEFTE
ncbi:MAG: immunoglobulin-like domain-containing protein [Lachnospiraceae bacterium]